MNGNGPGNGNGNGSGSVDGDNAVGDGKGRQPYRAALAVYVVWHPDFKRGEKVANALYLHFAQDGSLPGIRRGIGVPVFFRSAAAGSGSVLPARIDLSQADHTVVVPLVDLRMMEAANNGDGWDTYFKDLLAEMGGTGPHRMFPIAFIGAARTWAKAFGNTQAISLRSALPPKTAEQLAEEAADPDKKTAAKAVHVAAEDKSVLHDITHELARLLLDLPRTAQFSTAERLGAAPITLFLSHAKRDGETMIKQIRDYVTQNLPLGTFFDRTSIAAGHDFASELMGSADGAAMLVLLTDYYASRPWCQLEVLRTKRSGRPVLVIDALESGEERSFPYIGNTPTVRRQEGPAGIDSAIGYLLREVLRTEHFKRYVANLKALADVESNVWPLPYPPELLTAMALRMKEREEREKAAKPEAEAAGPGVKWSAPLYIYPDPPIGAAEQILLTELDPDMRWSTPTLLLSNPKTVSSGSPLKQWRVGLSISESVDLAPRGFGEAHLKDAFAEIARHLLSAGATLGTGHDLRKGGYGEALIQLAQAYFAEFEREVVPLHSYLGWSAQPLVDEDKRAELIQLVRFHFGPAPQQPMPADPKSPEHACWRARGFTAMREEMNKDIQARVFLGGKIEGVNGPLPGVMEEAWLALRDQKAVYLLGAFGGATGDILRVLRGETGHRLTKEWHLASELQKAVVAAWDRWAPANKLEPVSFAPPVDVDPARWWEALHNGLDQTDNERLATTAHIPEMVALILRGLTRLAGKK